MQRFIKMATQGELLKLHHFLPGRRTVAKTKIHQNHFGQNNCWGSSWHDRRSDLQLLRPMTDPTSKPILLLSVLAGSGLPPASKSQHVEVHVDKVRKTPIWRTDKHDGDGDTPAWDGHVVLAGPADDWKAHDIVLVLTQDDESSPQYECRIELSPATRQSLPARWYALTLSNCKGSVRRRRSFFSSRGTNQDAMETSDDPETTWRPQIFLAVTLIKPEMFGQSITETKKLREEIREAQANLFQKNSEVAQHQALVADVHKQREDSEREFAALVESFESMKKQAADEKAALVKQVLKLQSRIKEVEFTGKTQADTIQRFAEDHKSPSSRPAGASLNGLSPRFLEVTKSAQGKVKGSPVAAREAANGSPLSMAPKPSIIFDQKLDQKHQKKQQDMELERQARALKAEQNQERERQERAVAAKARMDARKQKLKSTTEKG